MRSASLFSRAISRRASAFWIAACVRVRNKPIAVTTANRSTPNVSASEDLLARQSMPNAIRRSTNSGAAKGEAKTKECERGAAWPRFSKNVAREGSAGFPLPASLMPSSVRTKRARPRLKLLISVMP